VPTPTQQPCSTKHKNTNTYKQKQIHAQRNGPSATKPKPENCKNCSSKCAYTGWPKKFAPFLYRLSLPNINRFLNYIVITLSLKFPPHLKCVATLPGEITSVLKATTKNKTTSEVKRPTLIVKKIFINKQNADQMPMTTVMTSLWTGRRIIT